MSHKHNLLTIVRNTNINKINIVNVVQATVKMCQKGLVKFNYSSAMRRGKFIIATPQSKYSRCHYTNRSEFFLFALLMI